MRRLSSIIPAVIISIFATGIFSAIAETTTLTTYYPAPYGEYQDLVIGGFLAIDGSTTAPDVSSSGEGRIYFDSTQNKFLMSENGGSYTGLGGGPWETDGDDIYNTNTGTVGIGVTDLSNVTAKLYIVGDASGTTASVYSYNNSNAGQGVHGVGSGNAWGVYGQSLGTGVGVGAATSDGTALTAWNTSGNGSVADFYFQHATDGSGTTILNCRNKDTSRFIVKRDGKVGIGTPTPTAQLEVVGGPIKATGGLIIETRTTDPSSPEQGQIWMRTDL